MCMEWMGGWMEWYTALLEQVHYWARASLISLHALARRAATLELAVGCWWRVAMYKDMSGLAIEDSLTNRPGSHDINAVT